MPDAWGRMMEAEPVMSHPGINSVDGASRVSCNKCFDPRGFGVIMMGDG